MNMRFSSMAVVAILLFATDTSTAAQRETGRLIVALMDTERHPITNAIITVETPKRLGWGRGCDSEYNRFSAMSDTNGLAVVVFDFCHPSFVWYASAPSHHCYRRHYIENFDSAVVSSDYLFCDTNTIGGLARFNELRALEDAGDYISFTNLLSKFKPKSVTYTDKVIERSLCYFPKRNPQPMYYNREYIKYRLPMTGFATETNGNVEVRRYQSVHFDMKIGRFLPPWGGRGDFDPGEVSDFEIVRNEFSTNGMSTRSGWLEFAPGCGAYKGTMPQGDHFQGFYYADTNAVYLSRIPFEQRNHNGVWTDTIPLLADDEYMVLRTRAVTNDVGVVTNCNYAAIIGRMHVPWKSLSIDRMTFNPRPNDTNLECDLENNLAETE